MTKGPSVDSGWRAPHGAAHIHIFLVRYSTTANSFRLACYNPGAGRQTRRPTGTNLIPLSRDDRLPQLPRIGRCNAAFSMISATGPRNGRMEARTEEMRSSRAQPRFPARLHGVRCRATGFGAPKSPKRKQEGVVDIVNVRDWGDIAEPGFDVGDLKPQGPIRRVLDNSKELPFTSVVSNFLADAEGSGSIRPPEDSQEREIPPFERWAFREEHYEQYLVDIGLVNGAMKRAVERCAALDGPGTVLNPVDLGIYRGDAIANDLCRLQMTRRGERDDIVAGSGYAQAYASLLDAIEGTDAVNAHVYMLSITQLAMGNRIGSVCVEKLGLIGRKAASAYLDFDSEKPPLAVLTEAVNALGDGMSDQAKEVFFEALLVAASRCSLLVDSLART